MERLKATKAPYIAFEIGGTMNGLQSAVRLTQEAGKAGADAIKVQILDAKRLVGGQPLVHYLNSRGEECSEPQIDALMRRHLEPDGWRVVFAMAKDYDLDLIATVDFPHTLEFALEHGAAAIKICSGDITHIEWIEIVASRCASAGVPVLLDTGNATLFELERAVLSCNNAGVVTMVHHVAPGYPAAPQNINLDLLVWLRRLTNVHRGYSSHTNSWGIDAMAVALGAEMVEKNLTLDRFGKGPEQSSAITVGIAKLYVDSLKEAASALGNTSNLLMREENEDGRKRRLAARRGAWLTRSVKKDEYIIDGDNEYRRPAALTGYQPGEIPAKGRYTDDLAPGPLMRGDVV